MTKKLILSLVIGGIILGALRILLGKLFSLLQIDPGYFFDIFILCYLIGALYIIRPSLKLGLVIISGLIIMLLSIVIFDLYLLFVKYNLQQPEAFLSIRLTVALYLLPITLLAAVIYYLLQKFLLRSRKTL